MSRHRHWQPSRVQDFESKGLEERKEVALVVMGLLLGLLVLGDLTVVTYGKATNGGLEASVGTGKKVGVWD